MPNNKDNQKSGSQSPTGNKPDREFESQGKNPNPGKGEQGQQAGGTGSHKKMDDDDMTTAGGREGNFSDKNRGKEGQWSPGSSEPSDQ